MEEGSVVQVGEVGHCLRGVDPTLEAFVRAYVVVEAWEVGRLLEDDHGLVLRRFLGNFHHPSSPDLCQQSRPSMTYCRSLYRSDS